MNKFVRVSSLVGKYFYKMYLVKKFELVFSFYVKDTNIIPCLRSIILSVSACQSECARRHKTVNMIVFLVKRNENTYPKGRARMPIYRVVPLMKKSEL